MPSRGARRALKTATSAVDILRTPPRGLVVLAYHRVGAGSGLDIDLHPDLFTSQIEELAERGVLTLDEGLDALTSPAPATRPDPVVVTFDDGTVDFAEVALPILVRHRVPVTLYVATRFVDEGVSFPADGRPLSWAALRDCASTGLVTLGSHTHTHALLDRLPATMVDGELDRSIELLADRAGVAPSHFAYPKGVAGSAPARAAVAHRFHSAALGGTRPNPFGRADRYELARSPIQASDGMRWFRRKVAGGMALEDDLRRFVNRWRYAGATT